MSANNRLVIYPSGKKWLIKMEDVEGGDMYKYEGEYDSLEAAIQEAQVIIDGEDEVEYGYRVIFK